MSKWNKYRLSDFHIASNGKPYLYARFNTLGVRGAHPQTRPVWFHSKIDGSYVYVLSEEVEELERDIDWITKFPIALEGINDMQKSVVEEIEGTPIELDKFSLLNQAIQSENDTVIFYKQLQELFPEYAQVLQDIIDEELKHVGQFQVLIDESSTTVAKKIEEGQNEAAAQLNGINIDNNEVNSMLEKQHSMCELQGTDGYFTDKQVLEAFNDENSSTEKLVQSSSNKAFNQNIKTEIDAGKDPKQAVAIAYDVQRRNADENIKQDELESKDPEAKEACACEDEDSVYEEINKAFEDTLK